MKQTFPSKDLHLELLRVVSCLLVVVLHVSNIYSRSYPDIPIGSYLTSLACNSLARVSVPLFFMISGTLLAGREPNLPKCRARLKKYLLVTVFWVVFYLVWTTCYLGQAYDLRNLIAVPPSTHLWFLYAILTIYAVLPVVQVLTRALDRQPPALTYWLLGAFAVSVAGQYVLSFTPLKTKYLFPIAGGSQYFAMFFWGYYLSRHPVRCTRRTLALGLLGGSGGAAMLTALATFQQGVHNEHFFEYRDPLIILAATAAFLLARCVPEERLRGRRVLAHISENSFGIYVFHAVFLNIFRTEIPMTALHAACGIPLYTALIFLLADGTVTLLRRIRPLRYFL